MQEVTWMLDTLAGPRAVILAVLVVGAVSPLGALTPTAGAAGCTDQLTSHTIEDYIQSSTPLSEHFSVSQILHQVEDRDGQGTTLDEEADANGVDAYVHDLGCASHNLEAHLTASTGSDLTLGPDAVEVTLHYYDGSFDYLGETDEDPDGDGAIEDGMPDRTRYVVVHLVEGPVMSGINYETFPPEPYSVQFTLSIFD